MLLVANNNIYIVLNNFREGIELCLCVVWKKLVESVDIILCVKWEKYVSIFVVRGIWIGDGNIVKYFYEKDSDYSK